MKIFLISLFLLILIPLNADAKKIAVLPFDVLSDKPEYRQFGIGTMETLSVALTSVPDFMMIDRGRITSVLKEQSFQNSGFVDVKQSVSFGKLLGAEIIIAGTIQFFDNQFRITASFIEVETGKILKASKVTGNNIFELQDKIASQLIELENVKITETQRNEITKITNSTNNNQAFDYYTTGRDYYHKLLDFSLSGKGTYKEQFENANTAIEYFDKAINLDKNYFLAISSKSETQSLLYGLYVMNPEFKDVPKAMEYVNESRKNAELAFSISKNSGVVYRAFALLYFMIADTQKTIDYSRMAIAFNPNDKEAVVWLSMSYFREGFTFFDNNDLDSAIPHFKNCIEVHPYFTNAYFYLGQIYEKKNDSMTAISYYQKARKINSNMPKIKDALIKIYKKTAIEHYQKSDFLKVEEIYQSVIALNPEDSETYNNLASSYFMQKKYDLAEKTYKKAIEIEPAKSFYYENLGLLYEVKQDIKEAKIWYKKACDLGNKNSCEILNGNFK